MSLYNFVSFDHTMPDGKKFDIFYTKDIQDYDQRALEITPEGRLLRQEDNSTLTDLKFDGELYLYNDDVGYSSYNLRFDEGVLKEITCCESELSQPF